MEDITKTLELMADATSIIFEKTMKEMNKSQFCIMFADEVADRLKVGKTERRLIKKDFLAMEWDELTTLYKEYHND